MRTEQPGQKALLAELSSNVIDRLGAQAGALSIRRAVLGIFFTGVELSDGSGGLCATPIKGIPQAVCCPSSAGAMPAPGRLVGRPAVEILADLDRPQDLRRALAIATLNALVETLWRRDGPPPDAEVLECDAFDALTIAPGQRVVLVGAFPPYLRELRHRGQPFSVLERDPATLKADELQFYVPSERAADVLPGADLMIATGTTLLNGSLDGLLCLLAPQARAAVIGPTAVLVAGPYRQWGVVVVGGTRVMEAGAALDLLAEGGSGYHLFGKSVSRITLRLKT